MPLAFGTSAGRNDHCHVSDNEPEQEVTPVKIFLTSSTPTHAGAYCAARPTAVRSMAMQASAPRQTAMQRTAEATTLLPISAGVGTDVNPGIRSWSPPA